MKKQSAIAIAILAFCTAAAAQPYGVISVGASRLNVDCAGVASCDKTGTGFKVMGGYKFAPNWAGEIGYFDYGKAKASDGGVALEIRNSAIGLGLAFHQDLATDWNAVARFGLSRVKTKLTGSIAGLGSGSETDNNTAAYLGLGVGYKLGKAMSVDAAWDLTKSKFNKDGIDESGNINVLSIGLTFGF